MTFATTTQENKVAAVTLAFWAFKFLATTLGELSGDFLSITLGLGDGLAFLGTFAVAMLLLVAQIKATRFHSLRYWTSMIATVALSSESSDFLSSHLSYGHGLDTLIFALCLLIVFGIWQRFCGPVRSCPIRQRQEELLYWAAVFFASGLGVAFGDLLTDSAGIGVLTGALMSAGVLAMVLTAYSVSRVNRSLLFWVAFIFTRPFGV